VVGRSCRTRGPSGGLTAAAARGAAHRSVVARMHFQPTKPMVGFLDSGSLKGMDAYLDGFRRGLNETGYTDGQNVMIVYRWAEGRMNQLKTFAAELAAQPVDVIVGSEFLK
jgi:putative ABC transport system substrate-binding protein